MRCRNIFEAAKQAQANANSSGEPWRYFTDPSGYAHAERATGEEPTGQTWAGVTFTVVYPENKDAIQ